MWQLFKSEKLPLLKNIWVWHLLILCAVVMFHALDLSAVYRACLYLNVVFILYFYYKERKKFDFDYLKAFYPACYLFVSIFILHTIATDKVEWVKELNRLFYISFFCFGIGLQALYHSDFVNRYIKKIVMSMAVMYVAIQLISLYVLHAPYGTLKNPHYLAQYSMLLIPVFFLYLHDANIKFKLVLIVLLACVMGLLLHTNSRPAWLSLILTVLVMSLYYKHKVKAFLGAISVVLILWITDIGNFSDQLTALFKQITTEERVYIWRDIWQLQEQSTIKQWVFGHGLGGYESKYSHFGALELGRVLTFNSPHNFLLEILYTAGALGLIGLVMFYFILYSKLFQQLIITEQFKNLTLCLIALLTMNLFFVSIVVPIFSSYHLLITALVCGVFLYIKQLDKVFK